MSQQSQISTPTSSQQTYYPPVYSFSDLQDIWSFQKQLLNKYKSTQVPFVILDTDNKGLLTAQDFPYRLIARGFSFNVTFYQKFFAFLDTDRDGIINLEDWINGFKNIGARLVETRSQARDRLNTIKATSHSRHNSTDAFTSSSTKNVQKSFDFSTEKPWATPKNLDNSHSMFDNNTDLKRIEPDANRRLGTHTKGRSVDATSSRNVLGHRQERGLNINTREESQYDFALRMNMRVDDILKGIESRKALTNKKSPKNDAPITFDRERSETREVQSMSQPERPNNKTISRIEEIHQSIKKASNDAVGMVQAKLSQDIFQTGAGEEKDTYAPSVTSIAATEEEQKPGQATQFSSRSSGRKEDPLLDFESSLQEKIMKAQVPAIEVGRAWKTRDSQYASERSRKGLDVKESAKSAYTSGSFLLRKDLASQESKRSLPSQSSVEEICETKRNRKTIALPSSNSGSEKNLGTPSWKEAPKNFPESNVDAKDEDVLELIEDILAKYGGCGEVMSSYKKGDIDRFPHLQMLVKALYEKENKEEEIESEVRGRELVIGKGIKKRSRTKSMVELRVKGDFLMEMESDRQRRRAVTPENSVCYSGRKMTESPNRIANAEKMIESLKEFAKQKIRTKTRSIEIGKELAKEILQNSGRKSHKEEKGETGIYGRVQEKLREVRKYGEAKKTCSDIMKTLSGENKNSGDIMWNSVGYAINEKDIGRKEVAVRERGLRVREENQQDREKRSQIRRMIDQLSSETAAMEASINHSRGELKKKSFLNTMESTGKLEKTFKGSNSQIKLDERPEKRRTKSFLRGSISTTLKEGDSGLSIEQYNIHDQLSEKLGSTRAVNRYSKLASDLGTFSVQVNKPEKQISISSLSGSRSSKNNSISVSSLLSEELTGRGKSFLSNQFTKLDIISKDLTQSTRSLRRTGLNKF